MTDKNEIKEAIQQRHRAYKRFKPAILAAVARGGRFAVVDKREVIKSDEDAELFLTALNYIYGWDYKVKADRLTVYFELSDNGTLSYGVFDEVAHMKITKISAANPYITQSGRCW